MVSLLVGVVVGLAFTGGHASGELLVDAQTVAPNQVIWAAYRVRLDPGWHIYWKNPGDSGMATDIAWTLAGKKLAAATEFPIPHSLVADGATVYGYEDSATFLTSFKVPATAKAGSKISLKAEANWLECQSACMPGGDSDTVTLTVAKKSKASVAKAEIEAARRALPKAIPGWSFLAISADGRIELQVTAPAGTDLEGARFFSDKPQVIEHSEAQQWKSGRLMLKRSKFATGSATRITGILVAPEGKSWSGGVRAVVVDEMIAVP